MRRLRVLRFVLLALLLPFVIVLVIMIRQPPGVHGPPITERPPGARTENFTVIQLLGTTPKLELTAELAESDGSGGYYLEGVGPLKVNRKDASPLLVKAKRGRVTGSPDRYVFRLEGGVELEDEEEGLSLSLSALEVNEAAGEARSLGKVEFTAPDYTGTAASVVYGLKDQPTVLLGPEIQASDGSTLHAESARLLDGTHDFELVGSVRIVKGTDRFQTERVRLRRDDNGRLRHLTASGQAEGRSTPDDAPSSEVRADRVELGWNAQGRANSILLDGNSFLQQGATALGAKRVEALRGEDDENWSLTAWGGVRATAFLETGPAVLTAFEIRGRSDAQGNLLGGEALGDVRFESGETSLEAYRATFEPKDQGREIILYSSPERRAWISRSRNRVAARRILTDGAGTRLVAEGRVEASMLPAQEDGGLSKGAGLFRGNKAVHFVSARLEGDPSRNVLLFTGSVRAWQGERNLAADRVKVDQEGDRITAEGSVTTRVPRMGSGSLSQADFIQIAAEVLDYQGQKGTAVFTDDVQVRQAEGLLRAGRLEVDLSEIGSEVKELRAFDNVRFEFRAPGGEGMPRPVTGTGDRVVYVPSEHSVILYGDRSPASVRRSGEGGGTTTGRVLRYDLGTGALEVESGDRNRARIRTSEDN